MRSLRLLGIVPFVAILLTSCFKDENPFPANCKVYRATYYNNGAVADTATYIYTGSRVTRLNRTGDFYRFLYDSIYIVKRNYYTVDSVNADKYDTILYNSNKSIKRIDTYVNLGSAYILAGRKDFAYAGNGKLSAIAAFDMSTGTPIKEEDYSYIFNYNNIIAVNYTDYKSGTPVSTVFTYSHDSNANFFKRQNTQAFLIDPFFNDFDGTMLPFGWDANNVTNVSEGNNSTMVVLDLDAYNKNLMDVKFRNTLAVHYEYQCQ